MRAIPLLTVVILAYAAVALLGTFAGVFPATVLDPDTGARVFSMDELLRSPLLTLPLPSNQRFAFSAGDLFLVAGLILLGFEVVGATSSTDRQILNQALSLGVAVCALIVFFLFPGFGTATFLLITVMAFIDVLAGLVVTLDAARKDIQIG